jgi:ABC-2 type transport system ATP-binding protein
VADTPGPVIRTQGLSKTYDGVEALKSLTLEVPPKSIFAFLGPNGAGKTTTLKLLLGLTRPSAGSGTIFGKDIVSDSVDIRASVGYLPQDARFYEHMTARETLRYAAGFFYRGPKTEVGKRVDEMIELVGLDGKADRPIKGFSGGERQRLGIAQAEVNYPKLLILDEPAAALDPQGRRDVLSVMSRISKYATIFYCTHILDDAQRVSDQVAIVNEGELITQAPIEEVLSSGTGETVYSVTIRGDAGTVDDAYRAVSEQAWVSGIEVTQADAGATWEVSVTDDQAAEDQLLGLVVSQGLKVANFSRKEYALEDVFLRIVEGSQA